MTAATVERTTEQYGESADPQTVVMPVAASTKLLGGTIVCDNGSGYAVPGATSTSLIALGRCDGNSQDGATVDNTTGANGAKKVRVRRGAFWFANSSGGDEITIADRWSECYIVDNQTVAKTSTGKSRAGIVVDVDTNKGVLVLMGPALQASVAALEANKVTSITRSLTDSDLTDADMSQSFDFASALPANAVILGYDIRVTEAFTDGGSGVFTLDVGLSGGDLDQLVDGAALGTIANIANAPGVRPTGKYGAITLAATVIGDVNLNTATAGAVDIEVFYCVV